MNAPKRDSHPEHQPQEEKCVAIVNGDLEAQQVISFLESAGIASNVRGDSFRKLFDISEGESGSVGIYVAPANEKRARDLLRSADAGKFRLTAEETPESDDSAH